MLNLEWIYVSMRANYAIIYLHFKIYVYIKESMQQ